MKIIKTCINLHQTQFLRDYPVCKMEKRKVRSAKQVDEDRVKSIAKARRAQKAKREDKC